MAVSLLNVCFPANAASIDLLDRPAQQSRHMLEGLRTGIARAGDRLVSVGEGGVILLSDDQGKSWRPAHSVPVSVLLTNVAFIDTEHGWAIGHGGVVLMSQDGGENWVRQLDGSVAAKLELTAAQSDRDAGSDAGKKRIREAERLVEEGADKPLLGISFSDAMHGLVVGAYGLALATEDGGKNWQSWAGRIDNPRGKHLYAILRTPGHIFIAGEEGSVFRSIDGGQSFQALKTPSKGTFFGLLADQSGDLLAFGLKGDAFRSADHGENWRKIDLPLSGLNGGTVLADGSLIIVDDWGDILRSQDSGASFKPATQPVPMGLLSIAQAKDGSLVVAGTKGDLRIPLVAPNPEQPK